MVEYESSPDELKRSLQEYQSQRIYNTYRDFEAQPEYRPLVHFFLEEIYGPKDFSFRNHSIKALHQKLKGILKGDIIEGVGRVIELHDLSEHLDRKMLDRMAEAGIRPPITAEIYERFYRECDNYEERVQQIRLLLEATRQIHRISRFPFIGFSLKVVKGAASMAGYGEIMDFLYQGYQAFHTVRNIRPFLEAVEEREAAENDRLFGRRKATAS